MFHSSECILKDKKRQIKKMISTPGGAELNQGKLLVYSYDFIASSSVL